MHLKNVSTIKSGTPVHKYKKYTNMKRARLASSLFGQVETREAFNFPFVFHQPLPRVTSPQDLVALVCPATGWHCLS